MRYLTPILLLISFKGFSQNNEMHVVALKNLREVVYFPLEGIAKTYCTVYGDTLEIPLYPKTKVIKLGKTLYIVRQKKNSMWLVKKPVK